MCPRIRFASVNGHSTGMSENVKNNANAKEDFVHGIVDAGFVDFYYRGIFPL